MSIHVVPTVSCANLQSENVLKLSKLISSIAHYHNQAEYILIVMFSLVRWPVNYILIENKSKFYLR